MDGVISTPMTRPPGPTFLAAIKLSIPAPDPTSTTLSPRRNSPRLKGLPVPANDSTEDSGMPSSHSSAYSSMRARGLPVWKWKPFCGLAATSAYSSWIASRRTSTSSSRFSSRRSLISLLIFVSPFMKGTTGELTERTGRPELLEGNHAALCGHLREADRVGELRCQVRKVRLGHPTGDRARASDVHRYTEVFDLLHQ